MKSGGGDLFVVLGLAFEDEDLNDEGDVKEEDEAVSERSESVGSLFEDLAEAAKAGLGFLKKKEEDDSSSVGRNFDGV
ncbi:hypothetical protein BGZ83_005769 [Gryganskiella cystojenkinii]|nr:hypothetical protein BGZ83_005769 [Gryganskiella cystojenkinii]